MLSNLINNDVNRKGFNKDGFDWKGRQQDGYDREGFNYEGYNRDGYDPVVVNFSDILNESLLFYTPGEYRQHLQNIIRLLKTYDNYHVHLTSDNHLDGSMIYVREDLGVLFGKTLPPSFIFAINENKMTNAFWDYMNLLIKRESKYKTNRNYTIAELETMVARLEP